MPWFFMSLYLMMYVFVYLSFVVPTVSFGQTIYEIDEYGGLAQLAIILSNPSLTDITIEVSTSDGSATGTV